MTNNICNTSNRTLNKFLVLINQELNKMEDKPTFHVYFILDGMEDKLRYYLVRHINKSKWGRISHVFDNKLVLKRVGFVPDYDLKRFSDFYFK